MIAKDDAPSRSGGTPRRISDLIRWATDQLDGVTSSTPRVEAEWLLGHTLGIERHALYTGFERNLTRSELQRFEKCIEERKAHRPVQYITGATEFMSLPFKLTDDVAIPRPETEALVETVIDLVKKSGGTSPRLLDIGTGSGNIAISIAYYLSESHVTATDVDETILSVARSNAVANGVAHRVAFTLMDERDPDAELPVGLDFVVSNPPYLTPDEWSHTEPQVREWEPRGAFLDGEDGLGFYLPIVESARRLLAPDGYVCIEIAGEHRVAQVNRLLETGGFAEISVRPDLGGTPRVVYGRRR